MTQWVCLAARSRRGGFEPLFGRTRSRIPEQRPEQRTRSRISADSEPNQCCGLGWCRNRLWPLDHIPHSHGSIQPPAAPRKPRAGGTAGARMRTSDRAGPAPAPPGRPMPAVAGPGMRAGRARGARLVPSVDFVRLRRPWHPLTRRRRKGWESGGQRRGKRGGEGVRGDRRRSGCLESPPILLSDLVRVHPGRPAALATATAGTRSCGPGPPVYDYRGRGTQSHRSGRIHPYVLSCSATGTDRERSDWRT